MVVTSGSLTLVASAATVDINGELSGAGAFNGVAGVAVSVRDGLTIDNYTPGDSLTLDGAGTWSSGTPTQNYGNVTILAGAGTVQLGSAVDTGSLTITSGTLDQNGQTVQVGGDLEVVGALTVSAGTFDVAGDFLGTSTGTVTLTGGALSIAGADADFAQATLDGQAGSTVTLSGGALQTLTTSGDDVFHHLTIGGTGVTQAAASTAGLDVNGDLTLNASLTLDGGAAAVDGALDVDGGTTLDQNDQALTVGGAATIDGAVLNNGALAANLTIGQDLSSPGGTGQLSVEVGSVLQLDGGTVNLASFAVGGVQIPAGATLLLSGGTQALQVDDSLSLQGALSIAGGSDTTVTGTLVVGQTTAVAGTATLTLNASAGTASFGGVVTVTGAMTLNDEATFGSAVNVVDAASAALTVNAAADFNGTVTVGADSGTNGTLTVSADTRFDAAGISLLVEEGAAFSATTAGITLRFRDGATVDVDGAITVTGTLGNEIELLSSAPGTQWVLDVQGGGDTFDQVSVQDSDASSSNANAGITVVTAGIDFGNNDGWFGLTPVNAVWEGDVSGDWSLEQNWQDDREPVPGSPVTIVGLNFDGVTRFPPTTNSPIFNLASVTIDMAGTANTAVTTGPLNVTGAVTITAGTLAIGAPATIGGALDVDGTFRTNPSFAPGSPVDLGALTGAGTFDLSVVANVTVSGDVTVQTYTAAAPSTLRIDGAGSWGSAAPTQSYGDVTIDGVAVTLTSRVSASSLGVLGGSLELDGNTLDVGPGTFTLDASPLAAASPSVVNVSGPYVQQNGATLPDAANLTTVFTGTNGFTPLPIDQGDLTFAGTTTLNATLTTSGDVTGTGTLAVGTNDVTISGALTVADYQSNVGGTLALNGAGAWSNGSLATTNYGDVTLTVARTAGADLTMRSLTVTGVTLGMATHGLTVQGSVTGTGAIDMSAGGGVLSVAGSLTLGDFAAGTGTVDFNAPGGTWSLATASTFGDVRVLSGVVQAGSALRVGSLRVAGGELQLGTFTLTSAGAVDVTAGTGITVQTGELAVAGNLTVANNGLTNAGGTVRMTGAGTTIDGPDVLSFGDMEIAAPVDLASAITTDALTIEGAGDLELFAHTLNVGEALTVAGSLQVGGALVQAAGDVTNAGTITAAPDGAVHFRFNGAALQTWTDATNAPRGGFYGTVEISSAGGVQLLDAATNVSVEELRLQAGALDLRSGLVRLVSDSSPPINQNAGTLADSGGDGTLVFVPSGGGNLQVPQPTGTLVYGHLVLGEAGTTPAAQSFEFVNSNPANLRSLDVAVGSFVLRANLFTTVGTTIRTSGTLDRRALSNIFSTAALDLQGDFQTVNSPGVTFTGTGTWSDTSTVLHDYRDVEVTGGTITTASSIGGFATVGQLSLLGGTFQIDLGHTVTVSGVTQNAGALTVAGTGVLETSAGYTYTAGAVTNDGVLRFTAGGFWTGGAAVDWGDVHLAGGTVNTSGADRVVDGLTATGTGALNTGAGALVASEAIDTSGSTATTTVDVVDAGGGLVSAGGAGTFSHNGLLTFSGPGTWSGTLAGTGPVSVEAALTVAGTAVVVANGNLTVTASGDIAATTDITVAAGSVDLSAGAFTMAPANTLSVPGGNSLTLGTNSAVLGGLAVTGGGTLSLSATGLAAVIGGETTIADGATFAVPSDLLSIAFADRTTIGATAGGTAALDLRSDASFADNPTGAGISVLVRGSLRAINEDVTLSFAPGDTVQVAGTITIDTNGVAGETELFSTSIGSQWLLELLGGSNQTFQDITVRDSDASPGAVAIGLGVSRDFGNNVNWGGLTLSEKTWVGGTGGSGDDWDVAGNWNPAGVPSDGTTIRFDVDIAGNRPPSGGAIPFAPGAIIIGGAATYDVTFPANLTVSGSVTIDAGRKLIAGGAFSLTVGGTVSGAGELDLSANGASASLGGLEIGTYTDGDGMLTLTGNGTNFAITTVTTDIGEVTIAGGADVTAASALPSIAGLTITGALNVGTQNVTTTGLITGSGELDISGSGNVTTSGGLSVALVTRGGTGTGLITFQGGNPIPWSSGVAGTDFGRVRITGAGTIVDIAQDATVTNAAGLALDIRDGGSLRFMDGVIVDVNGDFDLGAGATAGNLDATPATPSGATIRIDGDYQILGTATITAPQNLSTFFDSGQAATAVTQTFQPRAIDVGSIGVAADTLVALDNTGTSTLDIQGLSIDGTGGAGLAELDADTGDFDIQAAGDVDLGGGATAHLLMDTAATLTFDGGGPQTFHQGASTIPNLQVSAAGTALSLGSPLDVVGATAVDAGTSLLVLPGTGAVFGSGGVAGAGIVTVNGTLDIQDATTFHDECVVNANGAFDATSVAPYDISFAATGAAVAVGSASLQIGADAALSIDGSGSQIGLRSLTDGTPWTIYIDADPGTSQAISNVAVRYSDVLATSEDPVATVGGSDLGFNDEDATDYFGDGGDAEAWQGLTAVDLVWDGATDGDGDGQTWTDPLNWDRDIAPVPGSTLTFSIDGSGGPFLGVTPPNLGGIVTTGAYDGTIVFTGDTQLGVTFVHTAGNLDLAGHTLSVLGPVSIGQRVLDTGGTGALRLQGTTQALTVTAVAGLAPSIEAPLHIGFGGSNTAVTLQTAETLNPESLTVDVNASLDTGVADAAIVSSGSITVAGDLAADTSQVSLQGSWDSSGGGAVAFAAGGSLTFDGAAPQAVTADANDTFADVVVNNAAGVTQDATSAALDLTGSLTVQAGTFQLDGGGATIGGTVLVTGAGSVLDINGATATVGDGTDAATTATASNGVISDTAGTGTLVLQGDGLPANVLGGAGAVTVGNLTIASGVVTIATSAAVTVNETLTVTGTLLGPDGGSGPLDVLDFTLTGAYDAGTGLTRVRGAFSNTGAWNDPTSGTLEFAGVGATLAGGGADLGRVRIASGNVTLVTSDATVRTLVVDATAVLNGGARVLTVLGDGVTSDPLLFNGAFVPGTGTIDLFNGAGLPIFVPDVTYANLTLRGGADYFVTGASTITVSGALDLQATTVLSNNGSVLTVGTFLVGGTYLDPADTVVLGDLTFSGAVTSFTDAGRLLFGGNGLQQWTGAGHDFGAVETLGNGATVRLVTSDAATGSLRIAGGDSLELNGQTVTVGGPLTLAGGIDGAAAGSVLDLDGDVSGTGTLAVGAEVLRLAGATVDLSGLATFTTTGVTTIDGGLGQAIDVSGRTLGAIEVAKSAGTATLTGALTTTSALVMTSGALTLANAANDVGGAVAGDGGTLTATGGTLSVFGDWDFSGGAAFAAGGGTVVLDGTADQVVTMDPGVGAFFDLQVVKASGRVTIVGDLDVDDGFDLDSGEVQASAGTLFVAGDWDLAGTGVFAAGGGTVELDGTNPQQITQGGNGAFSTLRLNKTGIASVVGALDIDGTFDGDAGQLVPALGSTVTVGGDWNLSGGGTFDHNGSTVVLDGSGMQTITQAGNGDFGHLEVNKVLGGAAVVVGQLTAAGDLTLTERDLALDAGGADIEGSVTGGANGSLTANGAASTIFVAGDWDLSGGVDFTAGLSTVVLDGAGPGGQSLVPSNEAFNNLTITHGGSGVTVTGALDVTGTPPHGLLTITAGTLTLSGLGATVDGDLTIAGGALVSGAGTLTLGRDFDAGGGVFTPTAGGTVLFTGSHTPQVLTLGAGSQVYANFTVNKANPTDVVSVLGAGQTLDVDETLTLTQGVLDLQVGSTFDDMSGNIAANATLRNVTTPSLTHRFGTGFTIAGAFLFQGTLPDGAAHSLTLIFKEGETVTVAAGGVWHVQGAVGQRTTVTDENPAPASPRWLLDVNDNDPAFFEADFIAVQDSEGEGDVELPAFNAGDLGNNHDWHFESKITAWTGSAGDELWSTTGNWTNDVPVANDDVVFPAPVVAGPSQMDIPGLTLGSLSVTGFTDTITLQHDLAVTGATTISHGALDVGAHTFTAGALALSGVTPNVGSLVVASGGVVRVSGNVSAVGDATISNAGSFNLIGAGPQQWDGSGAVANFGAVLIDNPAGPTAVQLIGPVTAGAVTVGTDATHADVLDLDAFRLEATSTLVQVNGTIDAVGAPGVTSLRTADLTVLGDYDEGAGETRVSGAFTLGSALWTPSATGQLIFDGTGTGAQTWNASGNAVGHVVVAGTAGVQLASAAEVATIDVQSALDLAGQALTVAGDGATQDVLLVSGSLTTPGTVTVSATNGGGDVRIQAITYDVLDLTGGDTYRPLGAAGSALGASTLSITAGTLDTATAAVAGTELPLAVTGLLTIDGTLEAGNAGTVIHTVTDVDLNGTLDLANANPVTLEVGGALDATGGALDAVGTSTVRLIGGANQAITLDGGESFFDLASAKTGGAATLTGPLSVANDLLVSGTGTLALPAAGSTVAGDVVVSGGTLEGGTGTIDVSGDWNATGGAFAAGTSSVVLSGGTQLVNVDATGDAFFNLTVNGAASLATGDLLDVDGDLAIAGGLTLAAGGLDLEGDLTGAGSLTAAGALRVGGDWAIASFTAGSSAVHFDGGADQLLTSNAQSFAAIVVETTGGALLPQDDLTAETVDVTAGSLDLGTGGRRLTLTGTVTTLTGAPSNFAAGDSTVEFAPSAPATATLPGFTYHDIEFNGPAPSSFSSTQPLTVNVITVGADNTYTPTQNVIASSITGAGTLDTQEFAVSIRLTAPAGGLSVANVVGLTGTQFATIEFSGPGAVIRGTDDGGVGAVVYGHLFFTGTGTASVSGGTRLEVQGNLTFTQGTVSVGTLELSGPNGGGVTFNAGGAPLSLQTLLINKDSHDDTAQITLTGTIGVARTIDFLDIDMGYVRLAASFTIVDLEVGDDTIPAFQGTLSVPTTNVTLTLGDGTGRVFDVHDNMLVGDGVGEAIVLVFGIGDRLHLTNATANLSLAGSSLSSLLIQSTEADPDNNGAAFAGFISAVEGATITATNVGVKNNDATGVLGPGGTILGISASGASFPLGNHTPGWDFAGTGALQFVAATARAGEDGRINTIRLTYNSALNTSTVSGVAQHFTLELLDVADPTGAPLHTIRGTAATVVPGATNDTIDIVFGTGLAQTHVDGLRVVYDAPTAGFLTSSNNVPASLDQVAGVDGDMPLVDGAAPVIVSTFAHDADANDGLDRMVFFFSEPVAFSAARGVSVSGFGAQTDTRDMSGNTRLYLRVAGEDLPPITLDGTGPRITGDAIAATIQNEVRRTMQTGGTPPVGHDPLNRPAFTNFEAEFVDGRYVLRAGAPLRWDTTSGRYVQDFSASTVEVRTDGGLAFNAAANLKLGVDEEGFERAGRGTAAAGVSASAPLLATTGTGAGQTVVLLGLNGEAFRPYDIGTRTDLADVAERLESLVRISTNAPALHAPLQSGYSGFTALVDTNVNGLGDPSLVPGQARLVLLSGSYGSGSTVVVNGDVGSDGAGFATVAMIGTAATAALQYAGQASLDLLLDDLTIVGPDGSNLLEGKTTADLELVGNSVAVDLVNAPGSGTALPTYYWFDDGDLGFIADRAGVPNLPASGFTNLEGTSNVVLVGDTDGDLDVEVGPGTITVDASQTIPLLGTTGVRAEYTWTFVSGTPAPTVLVTTGPLLQLESDAAGVYEFDLTVVVYDADDAPVVTPQTDQAGRQVIRVTVEVGEEAPIADAGDDVFVIGDSAALDGSGSYDPNGGVGTIAYIWSGFDASGQEVLGAFSNPNVQSPTFDPGAHGTYTVTLTVFKPADPTLSSTDSVEVTLADPGNLPPVASAGPDTVGEVGRPVTLDGRGSADPQGQPLAFRWTVLAAPEAVAFNSASSQPTFTPTLPGTFLFRLEVESTVGQLSLPDEVTVFVVDETAGARRSAPAAVPRAAGLDYGVFLTATPARSGATVVTLADGDTREVTHVDMASDPSDDPAPGDVQDLRAIEVFAAGALESTLYLPLEAGDQEITAVTFAPGGAAAEVLAYTFAGETFVLDATRSSDDSGIRDFTWTQVGGPHRFTSVEGSVFAVVAPSAGTYEFELTVTDNTGLTSFARPLTVFVLPALGVPMGPPTATIAFSSGVTMVEPVPGKATATAAAGGAVALTAQGSLSRAAGVPETNGLTYSWRQVAGPIAAISGAATADATVTPTVPGAYAFELTVTDANLILAREVAWISVGSSGRLAPVAVLLDVERVELPADGSGLELRLDGSASVGEEPFELRWSQSAGTPVLIRPEPNRQGRVRLEQAGIYVFELEVIDADGVVSPPAKVTVYAKQLPDGALASGEKTSKSSGGCALHVPASERGPTPAAALLALLAATLVLARRRARGEV